MRDFGDCSGSDERWLCLPRLGLGVGSLVTGNLWGGDSGVVYRHLWKVSGGISEGLAQRSCWKCSWAFSPEQISGTTSTWESMGTCSGSASLGACGEVRGLTHCTGEGTEALCSGRDGEKLGKIPLKLTCSEPSRTHVFLSCPCSWFSNMQVGLCPCSYTFHDPLLCSRKDSASSWASEVLPACPLPTCDSPPLLRFTCPHPHQLALSGSSACNRMAFLLPSDALRCCLPQGTLC